MSRKIVFVIVFVILLNNVSFAGYEVDMIVKISFKNKGEAFEKLKPLRLTYEDVQDTWARAVVKKRELTEIMKLGFSVEILYADSRIRAGEWKAAMGTRWTSYDSVISEMQATLVAHPDICRLHNIGKSVENRDIYVMEITDNPDVDEANEAEVRMVGNIHGDEYISLEIMVNLIEYLTDNYGTDTTVTDLVNGREIWIQPSINPDGHENGTRSNANGVDMNRNHGYMWNYGGSGPFSEMELQHLRDYSLRRNFSMSLTFHGVTTYFNYCWNFTGEDAFDKTYLHALGAMYTSWNGYTNTEGYDWYQTNGDTNDWSYGCRGSFDVTIETPGSSASQVTQDWNANRDAILYIIEQAGYGLSGVVTDSRTGSPLEALITVHQHPITVYTDPLRGDYHRPLQAGTYDMTVWATGHDPKTINGISVVDQQSTNRNVVLAPNYRFFTQHVAWNSITNSYVSSASSWYKIWPHRALGPPDGEPGSLGKGCELALDMGEGYEIHDMAGNDLIVYEANVGDGAEQFTLYGSSGGFLGPWVLIGNGNGTTEFDLTSSGLTSVRYFKFVDDGDGTALIDYPGYDLDGIGTLPVTAGCGIIMLDQGSYGCDNQSVIITVLDQDLNTNPGFAESLQITILSDTDPTGQSVTLYEESLNSALFEGTILLSEIQSGGGYLHVQKGDTITAVYNDANCQGTPRTVFDTAIAQCKAPVLTIDSFLIDDTIGNGNGIVDPGETIIIQVTLRNSGDEAAVNVQGTLREDTSYATVVDGFADWPEIDPGQSTSSNADHFSLYIDQTTPTGTQIDCSIDLVAADLQSQVSFSLLVGVQPILVIDDNSGSALLIKNLLESKGFAVELETASETDAQRWPQFNFLIWSCGNNTNPVSSSTYRSNLENYVAAGHSLWIEGGEIGYEAGSSPGYPSFAENVLHISDWTADPSGDLTVSAPSHPLISEPNILPSTMPCAYSSWGDQDAVTVSSDATRVCSWTNQIGSSSVIAFEMSGKPAKSGRIVYTSFNFASLEALIQAEFIENVAHWLGTLPDPQLVPSLAPFGFALLVMVTSLCLVRSFYRR